MSSTIRRTLFALFACTASADAQSPAVNWDAWGGNAGAQKYSALADINRGNVTRLRIAWTWEAKEQPIAAGPGQRPARPGQFQASALAINDTLYFPTPYNRVIALDAS